MNNKRIGWIIFVAGLGMILHLLSGDIKELEKWSDITYPAVISGIMEHFSAVITAFIGGNIIPNMFSNKQDTVSNKKRDQLNNYIGV